MPSSPKPTPSPYADATAQRDAEVVPVALKLIQALAKREDLLMGSATTAELAADFYQKVYKEDLVPILLEGNIKLKDLPFLFSVVIQPFQLLNDVTTSSFEMNRDLADGFKWGVRDIDELRVGDLDAALKEGVEAAKKAAGEKTAEAQKPPEEEKSPEGGDK